MGHLGWDCPAGFLSVHTPVTIELCCPARTSWEKNDWGPQASSPVTRTNIQAPTACFPGPPVAPASVGTITKCQVENEGNKSKDGNNKGPQVVTMTWPSALMVLRHMTAVWRYVNP